MHIYGFMFRIVIFDSVAFHCITQFIFSVCPLYSLAMLAHPSSSKNSFWMTNTRRQSTKHYLKIPPHIIFHI